MTIEEGFRNSIVKLSSISIVRTILLQFPI